MKTKMLISGLLVIVILAVGFYFVRARRVAMMQAAAQAQAQALAAAVTPTVTPTKTPFEWQTYANYTYGYAFEYPTIWEIWSVNGSINYAPLTPSPQPANGKDLLFGYILDPRTPEQNGIRMFVNILDNPQELELKDYFAKQNLEDKWFKLMQPTKVNEREVIKIDRSYAAPGSVGYFVNLGQYIADFEFSFNQTYDQFALPPPQIFTHIISTVRAL